METKPKYSILALFALLYLFLLLCFSSAYRNFRDDSSRAYTYNRLAEIKNHCHPFLSSASELNPDNNRNYRLLNELSIVNGDWNQENGGSPLMPFDQSDLPSNSLPHTAPLKLVSFQVKDIKPVHHFENTSITVGGVLSVAISTDTSYYPTLQSPCFIKSPGFSILTIVFEGVYFESEENGGESLMCMLGNTALPLSKPPFEHWDDQILLVLRYPQTFNLTRRAIKGELRSLKERGSLGYFDVVYISSQLSHFSRYQFSSEIKPRSCDPYLDQEKLTKNGFLTFDGAEFCRNIQSISMEPLKVLPNYKFNERYAHQSTLGPFRPEKEITSANWKWKYEDFRLFMQNIICQEETVSHGINNARISAVLRAFPAFILAETARDRTGISGLTLFVEGTWDSSSGRLYMIGCSGEVDSGIQGCDSHISLYFPRFYSIKQRSFVLGRISRISDEVDTLFPLLFENLPHPTMSYRSICSSYHPSYNYSKIEMATSIRKRNQPSKAFTLKRSFLKYPALENGEDVPDQLYLLSRNLNVNAFAICRQSSNHNSKFFIYMGVLSLGSLFGPPRSSWLCGNNQGKKSAGTENITNTQLLNISLHLFFNERPSEIISTQCYKDLSSLFLEGVYDHLAGDMHLIGCIKFGLDCLIEAKVQYPSETGRWLKNPSVKITITSVRNEDDPLHFKTTTLQTSIVPYINYNHDVAFRKIFEGALKFLISLLHVGIIFSQLHYMNKNVSSIPYISLVMLAEQILGYSAELLVDTGILYESSEFETYRRLYLHEHKLLMKALEISSRLLVLAALILTLKLYHKVSEAKTRTKLQPRNKSVVLSTLKIHIVLCLVLVGLLQINVLWALDFLLLPQVLENSMWQTQVKPLRKMYYAGLTLLRLILYSYDYVRDPVLNPYSDNDDLNQVSSEAFFVSGIKSIGFPIIMIVLASVIHIQQSKNYLKSARISSIHDS